MGNHEKLRVEDAQYINVGQVRTFAERVSAAMAEVGSVGKDGHNAFQRYDYTTAAAVQRACQKAAAKHGLYFGASSEIVSQDEYTTKGGAHGRRITLRVTVSLSDGEHTTQAVAYGCGQDTEDKAIMKAQTAGMKYALCALFCIGMGDDPEADEETDKAQSVPHPPGGMVNPGRNVVSEIFAAKDHQELSLISAKIANMDLADDIKRAARHAWNTRNAELGKPKTQRINDRVKASRAVPPEHDYGPPPMTDEETGEIFGAEPGANG